MAPVARVVVYYVRPDGEVVADALNFDIEGTFQNFVNIFHFLKIRIFVIKFKYLKGGSPSGT